MTTAPIALLPADDRIVARRQLAGLVAGATFVLAVSMLLDRSELRLTGRWQTAGAWTGRDPGLLGLRILRVASFLGAGGVLVWLTALAVLCVPARSRVLLDHLPVPGAKLVRRALIGTLTVAITTSSSSSTFAASRSIAAAQDANGGQRWPMLRIQGEQPTTTVPRTTTLPRLAAPTTDVSTTRAVTTTPASSIASPTTTITTTTTTAGPNLPSTTGAAHRTAPVLATRTVRAGESFWSIAEDEVLAHVDEATDADIGRYWFRLIDANRNRLPDPANPDLLWIAAELVLPPITPPLVR
jgi:hypothetical protein